MKKALVVFLALFFGSRLFSGDLREMSLEQKVAQLFVIPAAPNSPFEKHREQLFQLVKRFPLGGIIFMQGKKEQQVQWIKELQACSSIPLLILQDAEWGQKMRLEDGNYIPKQLTLGAIRDLSLIYAAGKELGRQCAEVGVHLNLAPVVDVNTNPANPVIGMRSLGEDPQEVTIKADLLIRGMKEANVESCIKHFPGHGDTSKDSHEGLPIVEHPLTRIEKCELYPFKKMVDAHVFSLLVGHLYFSALEKQVHLPATLSKTIVSDLLQTKWNYSGLVITDAMNMGALEKQFSLESAVIKAFDAGVDILLFAHSHMEPKLIPLLEAIPQLIESLTKHIQGDPEKEAQLDQRVLKILDAKKNLSEKRAFIEENKDLNYKLYASALTLLENKHHLLPLQTGEDTIVILEEEDAQLKALLQEQGCKEFFLAKQLDVSWLSSKKNLLIFLSRWNEELVKALANFKKVLIFQGSPYLLKELDSFDAVVLAYENMPEAKQASIDLLFGKIIPKGKLPVTISEKYPLKAGLTW